jgi:hypothetical protein
MRGTRVAIGVSEMKTFASSLQKASVQNEVLKITVIRRFVFTFTILTGLALACISQAQDDSGATAFEKLKALVGDWQGTYAWTGSTKTGSMDAAYYVTGNASALVENLIVEGIPSMTSIYHLDGADLRMTHYCAAQNQPRLKAERIDLTHGIINFGFVDVTNLRSADAAHVRELEVRLIDSNHITLTFLFQSGSKESRERIALNRVERKSSEKGSGGN